MGKRGLSQIVTVVIIIVLSLVIISILWFYVSQSLRDSSQIIGTEKFSVKLDIEDDSFGNSVGPCHIDMDVQRDPGKGDILYLKFIITSSSGDTEVKDIPGDFEVNPLTLKELETMHVTFDCNLDDVESISIAPVFAKEGVGYITDMFEPKGICGDGIVQLGEACDGDSNRNCNLTQPGLSPNTEVNFLGVNNCGLPGQQNACLFLECSVKPQCSDGVDNDFDFGNFGGDGNCDFEYNGQCLSIFNGIDTGSTSSDDGCWSPEDNDETPANFTIVMQSPNSGDTISFTEFPTNFTLAFQIQGLKPDGNIDIDARSFDVNSCWYELDGSRNYFSCQGNISIQQTLLNIPAEKINYNLTLFANDSTGDTASKEILFNVIKSSISIFEPFQYQVVETETNIPLKFATNISFPSSCWYSIDGGADTFIQSCQTGQTITQFDSLVGFHNIKVFVNDSQNNVFNDVVDYTVNLLPGDLNGDYCVNVLDLNKLLSKLGFDPMCLNDPGCGEDINNDGNIDSVDLGYILKNWNVGCPVV